MKKKIIAVIGCGRIAHNAHMPAFSKMDNIRVKYACDIILEKAKKMMDELEYRYEDQKNIFVVWKKL